MKKFLKLLALAAIAVAAALACVFAGCNKDSGDSGDSKSDYNFTIVYKGGDKDGQPVNGQTDGSKSDGKVELQICLPDASCFPLDNYSADANGKISLSQSEVNSITFSETDLTVFIFHVIGVNGYKHDCEITTAGKGDYTVDVTPN